MNAGARAAAFVAALGVVFGAAFGIGALTDDEAPASAQAGHTEGHADGHDHAHDAAYRLHVLDAPQRAGRAELRFWILDHDGGVVTGFDVRHEKKLHLIAVDTGFAGYQHLHPTMAADGIWSTPMDVAPGRTRLYADFQPTGGENVVAADDLSVAGPVASPAYSTLRSQRVDGFTVTALGDLRAGAGSRLSFEIGRSGSPVTDLEPYLGSYGHLVMLRESDGAYTHVHPEEGPAGPTVAFAAEVADPGRYHLYLDFQHGGVVRTAHFVLDAAPAANDTATGVVGSAPPVQVTSPGAMFDRASRAVCTAAADAL